MGISSKPVLQCHYCRHTGEDYALREVGPHTEALCAKCDRHIKYLSKEDKYGTKEQQAAIWEKTGGNCAYCGDVLNPFEKNGFSYDHIEPQSNGGGHETDNLLIACRSCNSQKGKKSVDDYRAYLAAQNGQPKWIFYYEILTCSKIGNTLKSIF